jgi:CRP-like cAMP-binding protein
VLESADRAACPATNRLLAALPPAEYTSLAAHCRVVTPNIQEPLHEAGTPLEAVYFPLSGLAATITLMEDGATIEVVTIGREGLVGIEAFFGADTSPLRTVVQMPGAFARLPLAAFRSAAAPGTVLHDLLMRYTRAYHVMAAQAAACNRLHTLEARCARWLLLAHDRAGQAHLPITHEALGDLLGIRRPSITVAMHILQAAGVLTYHRGVVTITDRAGLEGRACECYAVIRDAFAALPSPP